MANNKYFNNLFHPEIKERYLSNYKAGTVNQYKNMFFKSFEFENKLNKDLYNFKIEEIVEIMNLSDKKDTSSLSRSSSIIKSYIKWAIENGFSDNYETLYKMKSKWYIGKFNDDISQYYFSECEISMVENACVNAQDACVLRLLFEGICGESLSEILNLTINDIEFESNTLHLTNKDGSQRDIVVSNRCIGIIKLALEQRQYIKLKKSSRIPFLDLLETDHVIKNSITNTHKDGTRRPEVVYRRLKNLEEYVNLKLNPNIVISSGMLFYAKLLMTMSQSQIFNYKLFQILAKRFNLETMETTYSYYKKKLLDEETINKVYLSKRKFDLTNLTAKNNNDGNVYDKDTVIKSLRNFALEAENREKLSSNEYKRKKYSPSIDVIRRHYGTWENALRAAGLIEE